jgi:hypothetical protein
MNGSRYFGLLHVVIPLLFPQALAQNNGYSVTDIKVGTSTVPAIAGQLTSLEWTVDGSLEGMESRSSIELIAGLNNSANNQVVDIARAYSETCSL